MRVALVHDWLVTNRGGERVLDALCELFPAADVFTLLHRPGSVSPRIEARRITTSFLQRVPGIHDRYRHFLPLFPAAAASLDVSGYELVVSSSHCVAKGVRVPKGAVHVSYVHSPMRYMWDLFDDYFGPGRASLPVRLAARAVRPALQAWDVRTSQPVDHLVANSAHIAGKIQRVWGRDAVVVPPPVQLERFTSLPLTGGGQGGYFLWLGAFAPYKRLDVALEAFAQLGVPLWVVGGGQDAARLTSGSLPSHIRFLGAVPDAELPALYRNARALVFTAEEDFGITPLEAQACGRPVIAFARGGVLETVTERTGLLFPEQTAASLAEAVRAFPSWEQGFRPEHARAQALRFSRSRFLDAFAREVEAACSRRGRPSPFPGAEPRGRARAV
ncbi:MAG: glycosyltransferase [Myxococcaceae bacterium]|nr:glycosyltransferase [Myxococcaceae bacterium]MCI0669779.1 glycosyltransferase [Myxococcaceae bacterium]